MCVCVCVCVCVCMCVCVGHTKTGPTGGTYMQTQSRDGRTSANEPGIEPGVLSDQRGPRRHLVAALTLLGGCRGGRHTQTMRVRGFREERIKSNNKRKL